MLRTPPWEVVHTCQCLSCYWVETSHKPTDANKLVHIISKGRVSTLVVVGTILIRGQGWKRLLLFFSILTGNSLIRLFLYPFSPRPLVRDAKFAEVSIGDVIFI